MRRKKVHSKLRDIVYLGGEGSSERSYGAYLAELARQRTKDITIRVHKGRRGGGDPLAVLEEFLNWRTGQERGQRAGLRGSFLLLDSDRWSDTDPRCRMAGQQAAKTKTTLIFSCPCFEEYLLRHWAAAPVRRSTNCDAAIAALRRIWPEYDKSADRQSFEHHLPRDGWRRVTNVHHGWTELFRSAKLMD
jgi:hypothetical protein